MLDAGICAGMTLGAPRVSFGAVPPDQHGVRIDRTDRPDEWLRRTNVRGPFDFCLRLGPRDNEIEHRTFPAEWSWLPGSEQLTGDERDRLVERGAARTGVTHRGVLVTDRHAAEEDEPVRG